MPEVPENEGEKGMEVAVAVAVAETVAIKVAVVGCRWLSRYCARALWSLSGSRDGLRESKCGSRNHRKKRLKLLLPDV